MSKAEPKEYYQVRYRSYIFHASVKTKDHITTKHYEVEFGGKTSCVSFSVYAEESQPNLDGTNFSKDCATNMELERGDLGTVLMVNAAMMFIYDRFPQQHGDIVLKDWSKINCKRKRSLSLAYYYLIRHGQTWYQQKFKARLHNERFANGFKAFQGFLDEAKNKVEWPDFVKTYITPCDIIRADLLLQVLEPYYTQSNTYREFFSSMAEKKLDCIHLSEWTEKFVEMHLQLPAHFDNVKWIINKDFVIEKRKGSKSFRVDKMPLTSRPAFMSGGGEDSDDEYVMPGLF